MKKKVKNPFFIIGCNRSGTSLLRTMLNHHPQVAVPPEAVFFVDYLKVNRKKGIGLHKKLITSEPGLKEWGIQINDGELKGIGNVRALFEFVHKKYVKSNAKLYWGNKTPRFTKECTTLKEIFPEAVFIHVIRDPRAVAYSLTQTKIFKSNVYFAAKRWKSYVDSALFLEEEYKGDVLRVHYDELVKNPQDVLKRVCKFLNLRYSKKMLDYQDTGHNEYLPYHKNLYKNLSKKPFKYKINYWRKVLTGQEVGLIERVCRPTMLKVGFRPTSKGSNVNISKLIYYHIDRVFGFCFQVVYYALTWPQYFTYTVFRKIRFGTIFAEAGSLLVN